MNRHPKAPGLAVHRTRDRWWAFWYRRCGWGLGVMSESRAATPFAAITKVLEQAETPCGCTVCTPRATIAERMPA